MCQSHIPNNEAEGRKAVESVLNGKCFDDKGTNYRDQPLVGLVGVNVKVEKKGYGFQTALIFAPHWTMPDMKSGTRNLPESGFDNEISRADTYSSPGKGIDPFLNSFGVILR